MDTERVVILNVVMTFVCFELNMTHRDKSLINSLVVCPYLTLQVVK